MIPHDCDRGECLPKLLAQLMVLRLGVVLIAAPALLNSVEIALALLGAALLLTLLAVLSS